MKERVLLILQEKHLTSAKLADLINVQRSSISHILSGRNKPSMDFMQKLLETFPDISGDWLITGKGDMHKLKEKPVASAPEPVNMRKSGMEGLFEEKVEAPKATAIKAEAPEPEKVPQELIKAITHPIQSVTRKIKRLIIYYDDNSYEELFPSQG